MAVKRRGVPAAGPPAAKRACREEEKEKKEEEFNGARFKALLRDPTTAGKGEGPGGCGEVKACSAGAARAGAAP